MFNDRNEVCFLTNVFPECMNSKVYRLQHDELLREQSVPHPYQPITSICVLFILLARLEKHMGLIESQGVHGLDCFTHVRISPLTMHIYFINTIVKSL